ncbi:MAG: glycosyltransferase family 9 protein [Candidatus Krumholzibacteriia bacterium]
MKSQLARDVTRQLDRGGRILVTRLDYLGDVILSLPLVRALQRRFPDAEIDYLTRRQGADVLTGEPGLGRVFRVPEKREGTGAMIRLIRGLRRRRYGAAIDLYSNPRSAVLCRLSGARLRIGGARRIRRHLYTHALRVPAAVRAATEHHLFFGKCLGVEAGAEKPNLTISESEIEKAGAVLASLGCGDRRPLVGIHPGGKWEVKRWPGDRFTSLAERLIERGCRVAVFCGPGEQDYRDAMRGRLGERAAYVPSLGVRETAAVIHELDGIVVCDGGIMHVSVAVGTPTVGIFGSSEPDVWFPYERYGPYTPAWVPVACRPCHSHFCDHLSCLNYLSVEAVERKLDSVLDGASTHPTASRQEHR